jgi:hypothetical protein
MRFLNALDIGAVCGEPEWTVTLLDALLITPPVVAAPQVVEYLIGRGRP